VTGISPVVIGSSRHPQLAGLSGVLLVQCAPDEAMAAAAVADRPGAGLVVTASRGRRRDMLAVANYLRRMNDYRRPLLLDAGRYSGTRRVVASEAFSLDWTATQRELGLPVLTDSGYVAEGDEAGLVSILERARDLGDAIATLALHISWLKPDAELATLIHHVREFDVPVALVLEHAGDPLGVKAVMVGLPRLLACGVPVILLRCDVSALGSLCFGATAAAVGTRTSLRHLYPAPKDGDTGGGGQQASISAVVKECLAFISIDKIAFAAQADPDNDMWTCACEACLQRRLHWFAMLPDRQQQETAAFRHSIEVLLDLRDQLLNPALTLPERRESWRQHCFNAQFRHDAIESDLHAWNPPAFLGRWLAATAPTRLHERIR